MEKAAETIGDDFYILPSSIHETILVPVRGKEDEADKLAEMVACVNSSEVPDTEILSNHVYRYRRQSRRDHVAVFIYLSSSGSKHTVLKYRMLCFDALPKFYFPV